MRTLVLFTRDLRVHDHPALAAAASVGEVLPLFVLDPRPLHRSPNRSSFLIGALRDLHASLSSRGAPLVIRRGDPAAGAIELARRHRCDAIDVTSDVTSVAVRRLQALQASGIPVQAFPGNDVIPPSEVAPAGEDAYRVFTPYLRAWLVASPRPVVPAPRRIKPVVSHVGRLPSPIRPTASTLPIGGETAGRRAMRSLELATLASGGEGDAFVRQLAWRDFFRQLVAADPRRTRDDLRPGRSPRWRHDPAAFDEWWTATPPATSGTGNGSPARARTPVVAPR